MNSVLLDLNDTQKRFSDKFIIQIVLHDGVNAEFKFRPTFQFAYVYYKKLDEMSQNMMSELSSPSINAQFLYTEALKRMSPYLNSHNIGIVIDPHVERTFKEQDTDTVFNQLVRKYLRVK